MNNIWRLAEQGGEFLDHADPDKVRKPIFLPRPFKDTEEFIAWAGVETITLPKEPRD